MRHLLVLALLLSACDDGDTLRALDFGRTAIITGDFDTVEQLIQEVGNTTQVQADIRVYDGYITGPHFEHDIEVTEAFEGTVEDLLRMDVFAGLASYKTVFFSDGMRGTNIRQYNGVQEDDHLVVDGTVIQNVREAAASGSNLYFSDWTYDLMERAWPDFVDWVGDDEQIDDAQRGQADIVVARVVDQGLADFMEVPVGSELEVEFNYGVWAVPESVSSDVTVLVEADVWIDDATTGQPTLLADTPLVFSANTEGGTVVFTAFHNEAQISDGARDVLRYELGQLSN